MCGGSRFVHEHTDKLVQTWQGRRAGTLNLYFSAGVKAVNTKLIATSLAGVLMCSACGDGQLRNEDVGTAVGGIVGGLLGAQVGSGSGQDFSDE